MSALWTHGHYRNGGLYMRGGAGKRPVVVLNKDAKVVGAFPSVSELARYMGVTRQSVSVCIKEQRPYKRMRIMYEEEFKRLWLLNDTDRLKFGTSREIRSQAGLRRWAACTEAEKEAMKRKVGQKNRANYERNAEHPLRKRQQECSHPVVCVDTGISYPSITQASAFIGVHPDSLRKQMLKGRPCRGYTFVRIGQEQPVHPGIES